MLNYWNKLLPFLFICFSLSLESYDSRDTHETWINTVHSNSFYMLDFRWFNYWLISVLLTMAFHVIHNTYIHKFKLFQLDLFALNTHYQLVIYSSKIHFWKAYFLSLNEDRAFKMVLPARQRHHRQNRSICCLLEKKIFVKVDTR